MGFLCWRLSQQATTFLLRIQENSVRKRKPTVLTALWSLIMLNIYRRHILCSVLISYWTAIKYRGCTRPSSRGILSFWMEKMWSWCRWQRWRASHSIFGFHVNWVGWVVEISSWVLVYKSQFRSNRRNVSEAIIKADGRTWDWCESFGVKITMANDLGAKISLEDMKNFYEHPTNKKLVYIFLYACHMIKLVRKLLGDYQEILMCQ